MAGTRSSARLASNGATAAQATSPPPKKASGKRKAEEAISPPRKKGKAGVNDAASATAADEKVAEPKQIGIEEAMSNQAGVKAKGEEAKHIEKTNGNGTSDGKGDDMSKADVEMKVTAEEGEHKESEEESEASRKENQTLGQDLVKSTESSSEQIVNHQSPAKDQLEGNVSENPVTAQAVDDAKSSENSADLVEVEEQKDGSNGTTNGEQQDETATSNGGAVSESKERAKAVPSEILEKGLIYFFIRGRVGTDHPHSVTDVQRTHIVLRPLPKGASLHEGSLPSDSTVRLLALPKKILPKGPSDRFMVFTEKAQASIDDIKDFVSSADYTTASDIPRHTPAAQPVAEGIYAITAVDRTNHLAYMLTLPEKLSDLQNDINLASRGCFVLSTKNPQFPSPANTALPTPPKYGQEILSEFNGLRWMSTKPVHMDYDNAQFLFIGTKGDSINEAVAGIQGAKEELEKLEGEDEIRVESLSGKWIRSIVLCLVKETDDSTCQFPGDEAIFDDLRMTHKQMPKLASTW